MPPQTPDGAPGCPPSRPPETRVVVVWPPAPRWRRMRPGQRADIQEEILGVGRHATALRFHILRRQRFAMVDARGLHSAARRLLVESVVIGQPKNQFHTRSTVSASSVRLPRGLLFEGVDDVEGFALEVMRELACLVAVAGAAIDDLLRALR